MYIYISIYLFIYFYIGFNTKPPSTVHLRGVEWALGIAGGAGGGYGSGGRVHLVEDCGRRLRIAKTVRLV